MNPLEIAARIAASAKDAPALNREDVPPGFARGVAECAAWVEARIRMVPSPEDEFQRGVRAGLEAGAEMAKAVIKASAIALEIEMAPPDVVSRTICRVISNVGPPIAAAIRSIDPVTVTDGGNDGR